MSRLRPVGLGPIVGYVVHDGARIWIRAGDPDDAGADIARNRRTVGLAAIREKGKRLRPSWITNFSHSGYCI